MSARTVSLRALVVEDIARTADEKGLLHVAQMLRRADLSGDDLAAACNDLRDSSSVRARRAGDALRALLTGAGVDAAVRELAACLSLPVEHWIGGTCEEQGVTLATEVAS